MSLHLWTAHFYMLVNEYNRRAREARLCREGHDLGEFNTICRGSIS
jgi:hypothetical protein